MKVNEKNLKKYSLFNSLVFLIAFIVSITFLLVFIRYSDNQEEIKELSIYIEEEEKKLLNRNVDYLSDIIDLYHFNAQKNLKNDIKNSLDNVFVILERVFEKNKNQLGETELKNLLISTIKDFRNSKKDGYYFAIDMKTTETYVHARADFVGRTMKEIAGQKAIAVFDSYKNALKRSTYNGAYAYAKVAKPNTKSMKLYNKITYIKHFRPIDIMIGIGVYLDDYLEFEKNEIRNYAFQKYLPYNGLLYVFEKNDTHDFQENIEDFLDTKKTSFDKNYVHYEKNQEKRVAYFRYFDSWNWYIGVSIDETYKNNYIDNRTKKLNDILKRDILSILYLSIFLIALATINSLVFSSKIESIFKWYKNVIKKKNQETIKLKDESYTNELIAIENSKMAQIGMTMDALIHQWYGPLNAIGIKLTNAKIKSNVEEFNTSDLDRLIDDINGYLDFINESSITFRNFFKDNQKNEVFKVKKAIEEVLFIFDEVVKTSEINLSLELDSRIEIKTNKNYLKQVLMSIFANSIDKLKKEKNEKFIRVCLYEEKDCIMVTISDNAGGIDENLLPDKLFKYKHTTKTGSLGVGLYLSKIIVSHKLGGSISANNIENGALFKITIPK